MAAIFSTLFVVFLAVMAVVYAVIVIKLVKNFFASPTCGGLFLLFLSVNILVLLLYGVYTGLK